jgi:hypothetical protein
MKGDRTYKIMIERYPKNSKLLRSYGRFLEVGRCRSDRANINLAQTRINLFFGRGSISVP